MLWGAMDKTIVVVVASAEQHGDDTVVNVAVCFFLIHDREIGQDRTKGSDLSLLDKSLSGSRDGVSAKILPLFVL